jgi:hypothetical protein
VTIHTNYYTLTWEDRSGNENYNGKLSLFLAWNSYNTWSVCEISKVPAKTLDERKAAAEKIVDRMFAIMAGAPAITNAYCRARTDGKKRP